MRKLFEVAVSRAKVRYYSDDPTQHAEKCPTLTIKDVIGEPPNRKTNPELNGALIELEKMIGLGEVKRSVNALVTMVSNNYARELQKSRVDDVVLHRLFLGNPGRFTLSYLFSATGSSRPCLSL